MPIKIQSGAQQVVIFHKLTYIHLVEMCCLYIPNNAWYIVFPLHKAMFSLTVKKQIPKTVLSLS